MNTMKKSYWTEFSSFANIGLILLAIAVLLFSSLTYATAETEVQAPKRLLLIYSYHPTFQTTDKVFQGLKSGLDESGIRVDIDIEYMDSKSLYDENTVNNFYTTLKYKLSNKMEYDFIVTADDNALMFALKYQDELFPSIPITFLGVNNIELAKAQNDNPLVTGVIEAVTLDATIDIILSAFPERKDIFVVSDGTTTGKTDTAKLLRFFRNYPSIHWHLLDLADLNWAEFKVKLNQIDSASSTILLLSAYRDKNASSFTFNDSLNYIVENTQAPIFHPYEHGMGNGVFGGVVISHKRQGYEAGRLISMYLNGNDIATVSVVESSPNIPIFDDQQLIKYGVSDSQLPSGAEIRFEKPNTFEFYNIEIMILLLVVVMLLIVHIFIRYQNGKNLEASEKKLSLILDSIDAYIFLKDVGGKYLFANKLTREQFGLSLQQMIGKSDFDLYDQDMAEKIVEIDQQVFKYKHRYSKDETFWREDWQSQQDVKTTKIPLINKNSEVYALCGVSLDITAQKRHERLLEQAIFYDSLTGVPNRLVFMDRLVQAICKSEENNSSLYVAFFDIDDFKNVNKLYGHEFGDIVIKNVINRAKEILRKGCVIARLGGDEFYLLFESNSNGKEEVELVLDCISEPFEINGKQIVVTAGAGVTSYPQDIPLEPEHLMRQAEQALYVAKSHGVNHIHNFNGYASHQQSSDRFKELLTAFSSQELVLYYQPKVSLTTGCLVGVEALIRWNHPEEGLLSPADFLPDLERYNLIKKLDDWVIDNVLTQVNTWYKNGSNIPVSINVSHAYFRQRNIAQLVQNKLFQFPGLPPSLIEMEIVETNALENLTEVANTIRACNELGISFSLDDFGTGYSSLTYLQQLPVSTLKVDRSFVINMLNSPTDMSILEGILGLCRAFDMTAVAEGVETLEHGRKLKKMGYHVAQGYGIARPMPQEQLLDWIDGWVPPKEWNITH